MTVRGYTVLTVVIYNQPLTPTELPALSGMGNEYPLRGSNSALRVGKVTVGLASHRPCVTHCDFSTYGLTGLRQGDENPAHTLMWHHFGTSDITLI